MMKLSDDGTASDTVAVIVTRNRKQLLANCLKSVFSQSWKCDVLVVDNSSTDGTEEFIRAYPHRKGRLLSYIHTGENSGGAGGFNCGMCLAVAAGYQYIWLMDDDCQPQCDALEKLLEADSRLSGEYGWLSSVAAWRDGGLCAMNIQRSTPYTDVNLKPLRATLIPAVMASFVSLFVKADTVKKYGLPIKEFFIWGDDWEYTRRISLHEKCYVVTNSKVMHLMKVNTTVNIARDADNRLERYRYAYRNDVYLYRREGLKGWGWLLAKFIWHSIQVMFLSKEKNRKLSLIWSNALAGLKFAPEIEYPVSVNE